MPTGSLSDAGYIKEAIAIAVPFPLIFAAIAAAGWIPENTAHFSLAQIKKEAPAISMSLVMALSAVTCGIVLMEATIQLQVAIATLSSIGLCLVARATLPRTIFMCNTYMFLIEACKYTTP